VVEVGAVCAVGCFFGAAAGDSSGPDLILVATAAGEVGAEAPVSGGSAVAQPSEGWDVTVGKVGVDVGERSPVAEVQAGHLRPVLLGVGA
jgi:hypothetical protein